jgi:hypothetical protein
MLLDLKGLNICQLFTAKGVNSYHSTSMTHSQKHIHQLKCESYCNASGIFQCMNSMISLIKSLALGTGNVDQPWLT